MRNFSLLAIGVFILFTFIIVACDGESGSGDFQTGSSAENQEQGNCLYQDEGKASDEEPLDMYEEVVNVSLSDGILAVSHLNTSRQCGLWLNVTYETQAGVVEIVEGDRQDAMTGCSCCFNLQYEIPVSEEKFEMVIKKQYSYGDTEKILSREVDFSNQNQYSLSLDEVTCM